MDWSNSRILVTDGAGNIGSALVHKLLALGANVGVADDFSHGSLENIQEVLNRLIF
jgi:nucleoside-diphosphate-sugar epimerase